MYRTQPGDTPEDERSWIIYDSKLIGSCCQNLFAGQAPENKAALKRGSAIMFNHEGLNLVLKRYHRGGLVGRLVKKSYLYHCLNKTRMWREFNLLARMNSMGLPVPRPVAAYCEKRSSLTYGGELISEKIHAAPSLTETLSRAPLSAENWRRVGKTIAAFHNRQVYHADLNASNILLANTGKVYLVDFDKSEIRTKLTRQAAEANLQRLHRSLCKLSNKLPEFHFTTEDWRALEDGYRPYQQPAELPAQATRGIAQAQ